MVCSLGSGRMAAMARLLAAGSLPRTIADEVGNHKLAAQYIQREVREADEANLLDEEDMHVFDLQPMTDPLLLVCCNACKKPIKASQYVAHAELCKSLSSAEEIVSELDGGTGHKKPPRKERKKLLTAYASREQERLESAEADDIVTSGFHLDGQIQPASFFMEAKRNSSFVDCAFTMDGSGVSPGNTARSTGVMPPPTKRSKLIASEDLPISEHVEKANGVAKSLCISTRAAHICREFPKGSSDHVIEYQKPNQVREFSLLRKDVPAPLATKMFYSQRNHRLRSAVTYLYNEASSVELSGDLLSPKALKGNAMPLQVSSTKNFSLEQINVQEEKIEQHLFPSVQRPDQTLADSSDLYSGKLGGCTPTVTFSNHVPVNDVLRGQTAPVGIMRNNYLSKPFSFAGNSGTPLGTMQQPKGSVPVT